MDLRAELAKLHALQQIDYQLYQREQALKGLDSGETRKAEAIALLKRHDTATAALQKATASQQDLELAVKSLETKRATVHHKLYSGRVTNPKELGDLQKDEEMIDAQIGQQEERLLEAMDVTEAAKKTADALAAALSVAKKRWQDIMAKTKAETARLTHEIAALQPLRAERAAVVDRTLLRRYDEIRSRREGVGMAVTGNDSCPACHIKLTTQVINRLRAAEELTLCDNCGRILAWQGPAEPTPSDDTPEA